MVWISLEATSRERGFNKNGGQKRGEGEGALPPTAIGRPPRFHCIAARQGKVIPLPLSPPVESSTLRAARRDSSAQRDDIGCTPAPSSPAFIRRKIWPLSQGLMTRGRGYSRECRVRVSGTAGTVPLATLAARPRRRAAAPHGSGSASLTLCCMPSESPWLQNSRFPGTPSPIHPFSGARCNKTQTLYRKGVGWDVGCYAAIGCNPLLKGEPKS